MSDKQSHTTVPSGTTETRQSGSTRENESSGQSSIESRIDTKDRLRIGGPGRLPDWPISMGPTVDTGDALAAAALDITISHLRERGFQYDRALICGRNTEGLPISQHDTTVLIEIPVEDNYGQLVSLLDDLIQALYGLGFLGRIEIIDPQATGGLMSFPPKLTEGQKEGWETILTGAINKLSRNGVDWRQIMVAARGYWEDIALTTMVVKANILPKDITVIRELKETLQQNGLELEVMAKTDMWGLFGDIAAAVDNQTVRSNIGWPFGQNIHGMGISVSRRFETIPSTLGGYLKIRHNQVDHILGLGCHHGFRNDENGNTDPEIDSTGSTNLNWPCQSPAYGDIKILAEPLEYDISTTVSEDEDPAIQAENNATRQESVEKLKCIESFDPYIGEVVATSGWRNLPVGPALGDALTFTDWALIKISKAHCPHPINNISKMKLSLIQKFPEGLPHWKCTKSKVDTAGKIPPETIAVYKQGRTTGLTAGQLGGLVPAAHRVEGLPAHLHHRGFIVFSSPFRPTFCLPGDSGSWCLTGDGTVVGQLVGGHRRDGTGLVIPFPVVLEDIQRKLELEPGSITFP